MPSARTICWTADSPLDANFADAFQNIDAHCRRQPQTANDGQENSHHDQEANDNSEAKLVAVTNGLSRAGDPNADT